LSEEKGLVTGKGQVAISMKKREKSGIRKEVKRLVRESSKGTGLMPVTPIEDLAGIDAGKTSLEEMRKKLDKSRSHSRY